MKSHPSFTYGSIDHMIHKKLLYRLTLIHYIHHILKKSKKIESHVKIRNSSYLPLVERVYILILLYDMIKNAL
ncbi:hypothetical protein EUGRSUZ_C02908 [Eucalyptus grandis]|uniref:Uncharacterized protein n=2 Tax=Eucalyptus grandis TaxID=71139 RepID=A0ACC3LJ31_EUCGR|nr:hypothetical protein EUGRSUZ_C02908 [Eucalyptus grandis]